MRVVRWGIFLILINTVFAFESKSSDSTSTSNASFINENYDIFYRAIVGNFTLYYYHKLYESKKKSFDKGMISSRTNFSDLRTPILINNQKYDVEFSLSKKTFPDTSYIIVKYDMNSLRYRDKSEDSLSPWNTYLRHKREYPEKMIIFSHQKRLIHQIDGYNITLNSYGLIAVKKNDPKSILFLSGEMFLNDISKYYLKDGMSEENLRKYFEVRLHNYAIKDLKIYLKKQKCTFYTDLMWEYCMIDFSEENYFQNAHENVVILKYFFLRQ